MDKEPDEALVERLRGGDREAFTILVVRYQRPIYNAAYRILGNADDASDITQGVFLKVADRLGEYDAQYRFFSWIYRIALNEALNLLRRNGREDALGDDGDDLPGPEGDDPERRASDAERSLRIQRALAGMKADDRVMITLRHFSECSYREIGEILELQEKTVKSRLFEARQRLRALLADYQPA